MYNKKGDYGFPLYFLPSLGLFLLVIIIFSLIFFVFNFFDSPNLVIKSEAFQDSSKIINLLKSNIELNGKQTQIAELINLAYSDPKYKEDLNKEVNKILLALPLPGVKEDLTKVNFATPGAISGSLQEARWILEIRADNELFYYNAKESITGKRYFLQSTLIPLANNKVAKVNLFLDCFSCSEEEVNAIA